MSGPPLTVSSPEEDILRSFHGTVHTATLAVCTVLVIFIVILGTFGNGLVLLAAIQCRKIRSNFDVLVFNLAGADFIVCSCLSPTFLYLLFSRPPSPREFCGGFLFTSTSCGLLSLLSLVAIAAHRQSRVRGRVKGALTSSRTAVIIAVIYVVSLGVATGGTIHVVFNWDEHAKTCQAVMNSDDITENNIVLFFISPIVIISFIIIVLSYVIIARAVRIQTYLRVKSLQPILNASTYRLSQSTSPLGLEKPGAESPDMQKMLDTSGDSVVDTAGKSSKKSAPLKYCNCCSCMSALDKENKAVTMCLVVILIIALCWAPLIISHFIELLTGESIILYQVKLCGIALVFLNSALNPYMYSQNNGRTNKQYGRVCWDVLRCECRAPPKQKFTNFTNTKRPGAKSPRPGPVIGPDCATLQFLQPKSRPKQKQNTFVHKKFHSSANGKRVSERTRKSARPHKSYNNNIVIFGSRHLDCPPDVVYKQEDETLGKKLHSQTGVKTFVTKSCCHAQFQSDQSLIES